MQGGRTNLVRCKFEAKRVQAWVSAKMVSRLAQARVPMQVDRDRIRGDKRFPRTILYLHRQGMRATINIVELETARGRFSQ